MIVLFAISLIALATLAGGSSQAQTFDGYLCTEDCSGHEAGYNWAQDNNITSETDCSSNSNSFNEGCSAWVEENNQSNEDEDGVQSEEGDE
jgi:hypothetical protein